MQQVVWHWFQTAYGYDPEGPLAGVRYDGFTPKESGKGKWWEGLDPQELYTGPSMPMPNGITTIAAAKRVASGARPSLERGPAAVHSQSLVKERLT